MVEHPAPKAMKVWLIQSVVSPYRIPLFKRLGETSGVDFTLILLTAKAKHRPYWRTDPDKLPFRVETVSGITLLPRYDRQVCLNPFFMFKLFRSRPDVVICGGFNLATMWCWLYRWLTGTPYVIWTEVTQMKDQRLEGLRFWSRRILTRRAAAIVEAGTLARTYVQLLVPGIPETRLFRAYNCVENEFFAEHSRNDPAFLAARGLPERNLLFVGRLLEIKGVPMLLQTYKKLVEGGFADLGLVLLGDGPLQASTEAFRDQHKLRNLHIAGWVPNEQTAVFYGSCDVFMLLSTCDANPLVIFEALAAGIPIICSMRAGNAIDFVVNGENGYIVDPLDADDIRHKTAEVLAWDAEHRNRARLRSRELVQKANYADAARAFLDASREAIRAASR